MGAIVRLFDMTAANIEKLFCLWRGAKWKNPSNDVECCVVPWQVETPRRVHMVPSRFGDGPQVGAAQLCWITLVGGMSWTSKKTQRLI